MVTAKKLVADTLAIVSGPAQGPAAAHTTTGLSKEWLDHKASVQVLAAVKEWWEETLASAPPLSQLGLKEHVAACWPLLEKRLGPPA